MTNEATRRPIDLLSADRGCLLLESTALPAFLHVNFMSRLEEIIAEDGFWPAQGTWSSRYRPYNVRDGILQVPVQGILLHGVKSTYGGWLTGFGYLEKAFKRAQGDDNVRGVALMVDSPGGTVAGTFETAELIRQISEEKPVQAFVSGRATSAAYALASAADTVHLTPSSETGSVGVLATHLDASKLLDDIGIKFTYVFAGKHKVDGNPTEPLPDSVRKDIQASVDKTYEKFVSTVASQRSISNDDVRNTEARVFDAEESLQVDFADDIGDLDAAMATFASDTAPETRIGGFQMTKPADDKGTTQTQPTASQEEPPKQEAVITEDQKRAYREEGAKAERDRFKTVMTGDDYAGREVTANQMLTTTALSAEEISAVLKSVPKAAAAPAGTQRNHFTEAMRQETQEQPSPGGGENPGGEGGGTEAKTPTAVANRFFDNVGLKNKET